MHQQMELTMLTIRPQKVVRVMLMARTWNAKVESWANGEPPGDAVDDPGVVLAAIPGDTTRDALVEYIGGLNEDEQSELVAIAWIGRGTFDVDDWDEAVQTARAERVNDTADYLLGMPMLADYLSNGLEALGYAVDDLVQEAL